MALKLNFREVTPEDTEILRMIFTEILCKHFPDVTSAPVKRLSSKL